MELVASFTSEHQRYGPGVFVSEFPDFLFIFFIIFELFE